MIPLSGFTCKSRYGGSPWVSTSRQQHFSNNAENRLKSKQRTYQRIVERKLQSLEKKSSDGRAQLFNVENTIKLNEDRLHELQLKRAEELRSNYSTRNTKKK